MIVTKPRPFDRIVEGLQSVGARRVFIVGCGECATAARTGGEPEVADLSRGLAESGFEVAGYAVPDVTCHALGVRSTLRKHREGVGSSDAVVVLACGAGTQTVADAVGVPTLPGLESAFLGTTVRHGEFEERCQMCGECVLDETGGLCPVTACPKGILNGPCGAMWDGKCDALGERACVHVLIRERLAAQGRPIPRSVPPKDFSKKRKADRHVRARRCAVSRLRAALEAGEFVVTGEIAPPRGADVSSMRETMRLVGPHCHALNITDNQGASLHMSSFGACLVAKELGFEPIFQQTCRDRNRLALQSDLMAAWAFGIENVLIVTGDEPRCGDHPQARGVFDLDSTQLLQVASGMNEGRDMQGRPLAGGTAFYLGAAMFPEAEPWDAQLARTVGKIEAGARFFQTQAVFDLDKLVRAVDALHEHGAKVIAGVLVLRSPRVIDFVNQHLAGLVVPEAVADRIRSASDPIEAAVDLAVEQVAAIRQIADGVHIMPLGLDARVPEILARAGIVG
ncbi:MAG: methylenetetrahydrofolate reductase C-terminal domain-containing protein [Coriobacteriia bacterium]|nr:methylenetetrahydrofolate reductase C-terminal domain-containing protein [Coriobacteriia bacterium]